MEKIKNYATAIYQNAMTGIQSIRDLEGNIENDELQRELEKEAEGFNKIRKDLESFAYNSGFELKENNFFEKARLVMSIKMATLTDKSTRHIAEMMLLGTVMGLTTCYKDRSDHAGVSEELNKIIDELEILEEDNYARLKKFLKCMK